MKIAFEEYGTGKPFVLMHAFPLSNKMWQPQVEALSSENFRLILPDLRGFGESHNFSDINKMDDMAQDIAELLDSLGIERAIIGGLSMGGYVAFSFFKNFPEKIAALVLCDTNTVGDSDDIREFRFDLIEKIESHGSQALIDEMLPKLVCEKTKENNKDLVKNIEEMFRKLNPQAAIAALRGMAQREDNSNLLERISVPSLLIYGKEDKVTNLSIAEKMSDAIPDSRLEIIEDAGHYSSLEQPQIFNNTLIEFIKTIDF